MMLPRFLVPALNPDDSEAALPPDEAHHLTRVLRLGAGDEVAVFDGRGLQFRARVTSAARDSATVALLERVEDPRPSVALTLVQAVLKNDAMDALIRDVTMIGAEAVSPVVSARTTIKAALLPKSAERWRRVALASAKQCGRSRLPEIAEAIPFEVWVSRPRDEPAFLLVEPAAANAGTLTVRRLARQPAPGHAILVVGPEGGWTTEERNLAVRSGCVPLSLGRLTLRADAVALAAAAALLAVWDQD